MSVLFREEILYSCINMKNSIQFFYIFCQFFKGKIFFLHLPREIIYKFYVYYSLSPSEKERHGALFARIPWRFFDFRLSAFVSIQANWCLANFQRCLGSPSGGAVEQSETERALSAPVCALGHLSQRERQGRLRRQTAKLQFHDQLIKTDNHISIYLAASSASSSF